jgi:predicted nucleotidyltransferase
MYSSEPAYPTREHEVASERVVEYFSAQPQVKAVLLTNSCARGRATKDSCLDMLVLLEAGLDLQTRQGIHGQWEAYAQGEKVFRDLEKVGKYAEVDLEYSDGIVDPSAFHHGWTSGPDHFELEIGNVFAYSVPLWEENGYFSDLRRQWLPYYDESLRCQRLEMVRGFFRNNIDHIEPYIGRGLYFASFKRFYLAFGEFLQALFIARKTYPIAYDKHVREQIEEILGLRDLYQQLTRLFQIGQFESDEILEKARQLEALMEEYAVRPTGAA